MWKTKAEEACGEPAGRVLGHLGFHIGSSSVTFVYPRLSGQRRWDRRLWKRLARAPKAVAARPVARLLILGDSSRPESPGAP
eukprot:scaffold81287_cov72-Phaeocystis_antarctica.AAC.3